MFKKALIAAVLAGISLNAAAHRPWLKPTTTVVDNKDAIVTIDAAISEGIFDFDHLALKLDGLVITAPDGSTVAPESTYGGKLRNSFDIKLSQPGTYRVGIVNESTMASFKVNGEVKRWRGAAADMAKNIPAGAEDVRSLNTHGRIETFVTAVNPGGSALKPSGVGLELEPITNPNDLREGEQARWRFLVDGKPAAKLPFSMLRDGVKYRGTANELRFVTDAKGEVSLKLPAAGMYWVNAASPAAMPNPLPVNGRRVTYTATLEILPQ
jgi:hypothetical protein